MSQWNELQRRADYIRELQKERDEQNAEINRLKLVLRMSRNEHAKSLTRNREAYAGATGNLRDAAADVLDEWESQDGDDHLGEAMGFLRIAANFPAEPADAAECARMDDDYERKRDDGKDL